jgi:dynamin 1-like protein
LGYIAENRTEKAKQEEIELAFTSEKTIIKAIKKLISSYFDLTRIAISDTVPKIIMKSLIVRTKTALQDRLTTELYKEDMIPKLLTENKGI